MKWLIVIGLIWLAWHYLGRKPKRPAVSPQQRARRILGVAAEADEAEIIGMLDLNDGLVGDLE